MQISSRNRTQRGLGALGTLIVLILVALAGYYLYLNLTGQDDKPTCSGELRSCMASCNRSATDNDSMQDCERKCESDADMCRMVNERRKQ